MYDLLINYRRKIMAQYTLHEVLRWFEDDVWDSEKSDYKIVPADATPYWDAEIITAEYNGGWEGSVFVLFKSGGNLYEVNGGHCSCYGLEGQWDPEPTTEEALRHRVEQGESYGAFASCIPDIKTHFGW
jgi:hypothetical protein